MKKNINLTVITVVAFMSVVLGLVSCSQQTNLDEPQTVEVPVPGPKQTEYIEVEKKIAIGIHAWYSEGNLIVNGNKALSAGVTPDSTIITMLVANHKLANINEFLGDNRWSDTNGNAFTGVVNIFSIDGLKISAYIEPAEKFSTITKIHSRVSMVKCLFYLKGFFELQLEDGKIDYQEFELPIEVTYFLSDPSVDVEYVEKEVIKIQYDTITTVRDSIVYRDSIQYVDRVEYVPVTEYIHINHSTNEVVVSGLGYADIMFAVDDQWLKWHAVLDSMFITRNADNFGKAKVTYSDTYGFIADDMQKGNYTSTANGMEATVTTTGISFDAIPGDDNLKTATVNIQVAASFTDTDGETKIKFFKVYPFYFHKLVEVKAETTDVTPEITNEHTYVRDSTFSAVKDSEGNVIGEKVRLTVTRDDQKVWKIQYLRWETGLLSPTLTGTQVGGNSPLRATSWTDSEYTAEGWSGVDTSREGFTIVATSKEYKFRTSFAKVPGFGGAEESIAECNIIFGTRTCTFKDAETGYTFTISADGVSSNETSVKIVEDQVGTDEAAKAEVNGRGLQYEYCGTHFLSVEQYVGSKLVLTQSRAENLLYPKN